MEEDDIEEKEKSLSESAYLSEVIIHGDMALIRTFCNLIQITEAKNVGIALIRTFEYHDKFIDFITLLIKDEVLRTMTVTTLFRTNSLTTTIMTEYAKMIGADFLRQTIGPIIIDLCTNYKDTSFEVDPSKMKPGENVDANLQYLQDLVSRFLDALITSLNICPELFRILCNILHGSTATKFPGSRVVVIAGFFFLRFICPAIIAPEGFNVVSGLDISPSCRRALILVSKTLQTGANFKEYGRKEEFMKPMNKILDVYRDSIQYFLSTLSKLPEKIFPSKGVKVSHSQLLDSLAILKSELEVQYSKVEEQLKSDPSQEAQELLQILEKTKTLPLAPDPSFLRAQPGQNTRRRTLAKFVSQNRNKFAEDECPLSPSEVGKDSDEEEDDEPDQLSASAPSQLDTKTDSPELTKSNSLGWKGVTPSGWSKGGNWAKANPSTPNNKAWPVGTANPKR